jgi:hypothetical protein
MFGYEMRWVAFDSKDFKREKKIDGESSELLFFTPLGIGVAFDDSEGFINAYLKTTAELSKKFGIEEARSIYSSSMLKDDLGLSKATAFAQQLVDATSKFVSHIHISFVILPPKSTKEVMVGGERCAEYPVKTEAFLRNLSPMFSYLSAWNYNRCKKDEGCRLVIDSFSSKETTAWRELTRSNDVSVVSHGDEVHPLISYADIIAFLTDIKLYDTKQSLTIKNLENIWEGVFDTRSRFIDSSRLHKIKWLNEKQIDISKYMHKPTVFFISDDPDRTGVNDIAERPQAIEKKSKRLMELKSVRDAITFAAINGYSFRFFDPYLDEKYVGDGDTIVYAGKKSKELAEYLGDHFEVKIYKAKDIKGKLSGLNDS